MTASRMAPVGPATAAADAPPPPVRSPTSGWPRSARWRASCGAPRSARCWRRSSWRSSSGRRTRCSCKLDGIANWTDVASTIGIPAVVVALLMIGGEFDLSAGVMTGSAGLMMGILATEVGMNMWLAIVLTLIAAAGVGFTNGYMVMTTKLPSFIVTLATFFILQGVNLGVTKAITNQVVGQRPRHRGRLRQREQDLRRELLVAARLPDHRPVVDRDHRARARGSSRARASATGSSAWAATRTPRATSASRSPA